MGEVWRAEQERLGRAVALKVIRGSDEVPGARERFAREAELAAKVDHRNVVDIIEFGETDEGDPYLVMPLLRGETMDARLRREPPPSLGEVLEWTRGVLGGLAAIHDEGIVHRDLKPGNVFLAEDADGVVPKLLDFGISRAPRANDAGLTQLGTAIGTPEYMAPEQFESARDVDERADVYGVGAILFEALTGRPPVEGPDAFAIYRSLLTGGPARVGTLKPELPAELAAIVDRALEKDPDARFASAREMRDAIDALVIEPSLASSPVTGATRSVAPTLAMSPSTMPMGAEPPSSERVAPTLAMPSRVSSPPSTTLGDETEVDRVPMRVQRDEPKPERRSPVLPIVIVAVLLAGAGFGWIALRDTEEIVAEPSIHVEDASVEESLAPGPSAHVIAGPERLSSVALAWARLSDADRALDVRIVPAGGRWSLIASPGVAEEQAQRLATALGHPTIAQAEWDEARGLRPALLHTNVRLNVHVEPDIRSATRHVLAHDTIVVGLYGTIDGAESSAEGEDAVTYFIVSAEHAGWALSRFLEPHSGCMPVADSFVDARGQRTAMPADVTFARTHVELLGARMPVFFVIARGRQPARSVLAIHAAEGSCTLGEQLDIREIDGVVDEAFFTETARTGGSSLLLASWHPRATPPDDGVLEWAAYAPDEPNPVWTDRLPTAAYLTRNRIGTVSGSRDRVVRVQREHYVLAIRRPGEPRVFYRWQDESIVPADP